MLFANLVPFIYFSKKKFNDKDDVVIENKSAATLAAR